MFHGKPTLSRVRAGDVLSRRGRKDRRIPRPRQRVCALTSGRATGDEPGPGCCAAEVRAGRTRPSARSRQGPVIHGVVNDSADSDHSLRTGERGRSTAWVPVPREAAQVRCEGLVARPVPATCGEARRVPLFGLCPVACVSRGTGGRRDGSVCRPGRFTRLPEIELCRRRTMRTHAWPTSRLGAAASFHGKRG